MKKHHLNLILIISFLFVVPVNSWSLFGYDPEDCEATQPKQKKSEGDRYSISSSGVPLKNGEDYARGAGYMAGEVFNIVLAQNGNLSSAYTSCRNAFNNAFTQSQRIDPRQAANNVDGYKRNLKKCDELRITYIQNPSLVKTISNQKMYKRKSSKKADGYYEICYRSGSTFERYTYKNNQKDGLYESYYDNAQLERKAEYKEI